MSIKFARQIVEEMNSRGPISVPDGCVTGEEYEEWLYEGVDESHEEERNDKVKGSIC